MHADRDLDAEVETRPTRAAWVRRSAGAPQLKAKLAHLEPTPDLETPTLMTASVSENPKVTATGTTRGGAHGSFSVLFGPHLTSASIDLSQPDAEVDWS